MSAVDLTLRQVDATFAASLKDLWVRTFTEAYADEHTAEDIAAYCAAHFTEAAARAPCSRTPTRAARSRSGNSGPSDLR